MTVVTPQKHYPQSTVDHGILVYLHKCIETLVGGECRVNLSNGVDSINTGFIPSLCLIGCACRVACFVPASDDEGRVHMDDPRMMTERGSRV